MSEIYRDRSEGAAAKRQELLRRRRDELVTMPHAVRRVVVARSSRIAAGIAISVAGAAFLIAASVPTVAGVLARGLPGIQPAVLSTLLSAAWVFGLLVYGLARARIEHRFAVAMSHYVLPSGDVLQDIERLDHEHPDEVAKSMAHRLEVKSVVWPVLAAALVVPATAMYVAAIVRAHGWPVMSEFEASLATHASMFIGVGVLGLAAAIVMTRRAARLPIVAPTAAILALTCGGIAITFFTTTHAAITGWLVGGTAILGMVAMLVRRLRIERDLIDAEDPAAGSEVFSLRAVLRQIRDGLVAVGHALTFRNVVRGAMHPITRVLVVLVAIGGGVVYMRPTSASTINAQAPAHKIVDVPGGMFDNHVRIEPTSDGRIRIDADLEAGASLETQLVPSIEMIPAGWSANLIVELAPDVTSEIVVMFTPIPSSNPAINEAFLDPSVPRTEIAASACDGERPLGLHIRLRHASLGRQHVTFYVTPALRPASCK